jgi:hypothetical protein
MTHSNMLELELETSADGNGTAAASEVEAGGILSL